MRYLLIESDTEHIDKIPIHKLIVEILQHHGCNSVEVKVVSQNRYNVTIDSAVYSQITIDETEEGITTRTDIIKCKNKDDIRYLASLLLAISSRIIVSERGFANHELIRQITERTNQT